MPSVVREENTVEVQRSSSIAQCEIQVRKGTTSTFKGSRGIRILSCWRRRSYPRPPKGPKPPPKGECKWRPDTSMIRTQQRSTLRRVFTPSSSCLFSGNPLHSSSSSPSPSALHTLALALSNNPLTNRTHLLPLHQPLINLLHMEYMIAREDPHSISRLVRRETDRAGGLESVPRW